MSMIIDPPKNTNVMRLGTTLKKTMSQPFLGQQKLVTSQNKKCAALPHPPFDHVPLEHDHDQFSPFAYLLILNQQSSPKKLLKTGTPYLIIGIIDRIQFQLWKPSISNKYWWSMFWWNKKLSTNVLYSIYLRFLPSLLWILLNKTSKHLNNVGTIAAAWKLTRYNLFKNIRQGLKCTIKLYKV